MSVETLENEQRIEIARMERTSRDTISGQRASYFRSVLKNGTISYVFFKQDKLQNEVYTNTRQEYRPDLVPVKSSISSSTNSLDCSSSNLSLFEARKVSIVEYIEIKILPVEEEDIELASVQWSTIKLYAPIRYLVASSLKQKFGADSSDTHGWLNHVEEFDWLEDLLIDVKDSYQHLHNEEALAWSEIINRHYILTFYYGY